MKLLSKKEQHEILKLLSDMLICTSGTYQHERVHDDCFSIAMMIDNKYGEFELKKMQIEKKIAKEASHFDR